MSFEQSYDQLSALISILGNLPDKNAQIKASELQIALQAAKLALFY